MKIAVFSAASPYCAEGLVTSKVLDGLRAGGHTLTTYFIDPESRTGIPIIHTALRELRNCRNLVAPRLRWSEGTCRESHEYVGKAVAKYVHDHSVEPFDLIMSRYLPMEGPIAAYWAKLRTGVPWLACMSDPLPYRSPNRRGTLRVLAHYIREYVTAIWSQRIYRVTNLNVFPSQRLADWACERINRHSTRCRLRNRTTCIPFSGKKADTNQGPRTETDGRVVVRHIGGLAESREIPTLLDAMELWAAREKRSLRCEFVGVVVDRQAKLITSMNRRHLPNVECVVTPSVPYEESLRLMGSATACILVEFNGRESTLLPSKFCDYAVNGRPIIALTPAQSVVRDYLKTYGGGMAVSHGDAHGCYEALRAAAEERLTASEPLAGQFDQSFLANRWMQAVDLATSACNA